MRFTTIKSGSKGNCIYVEGKDTKVLVDCGCTLKYMKQALADLEIRPEELSAILLTHEHSDHISGVSSFSRKYDIPVFASPLTWRHLPFFNDYPPEERNCFTYNMQIGDLQIDFFRISHDAHQPVGMVFHHNGHSIGVLTDTGEITPMMIKLLHGVDGIIVEANHNLQMLKEGSYPAFLKHRIASSIGHLSNQQSAEALAKIVTKNTKHVLLAHLSENNNTPHTALSEVENRLEDLKVPIHFKLFTAAYYAPLPMICLE